MRCELDVAHQVFSAPVVNIGHGRVVHHWLEVAEFHDVVQLQILERQLQELDVVLGSNILAAC
eukprot:15973462-Heterocapsa_arctica.AAC.1